MLVAFSSAYLSTSSTKATTGELHPLYITCYHQIGFENDTSCSTNATQGTTQQINYTIQAWEPSLWKSSKLSIPIQNLKINYYNTFDSDLRFNTAWNPSIPQESVFTYSFNQSEVTIEPNQSKSVIITIHWADSAPIGRYMITMNLGLSPYTANYPGSGSGISDICVFVNPKSA
jgi:hypothetical protein